MRLYGVVSEFLDEGIELFPSQEEAEVVVQAWNDDAPEQAGMLRVVPIELVTRALN